MMPSRSRTLGQAPRRIASVSNRIYERSRGTPTERGYTSKWAKAAKAYIAKHPLCVECQRNGRVTASKEVDHIAPHHLKEANDSGDPIKIAEARQRFWDAKNNWAALCKSCHSRKTAAFDAGFGNAARK